MEENKLSESSEESTGADSLQDRSQQQKVEDLQENLSRVQRKKQKRQLFKEERNLDREKKGKKNKIYTISLITIFLIVVSTGIFFNLNKTNQEGPSANVIVTGETKEFKMIARQFSFSPSKIEVNRGDNVKLVITSTDVTHGMSIPQYGINEILPPGRAVNIEFMADKSGTFRFPCTVSCGSGHRSMMGRLVVK